MKHITEASDEAIAAYPNDKGWEPTMQGYVQLLEVRAAFDAGRASAPSPLPAEGVAELAVKIGNIIGVQLEANPATLREVIAALSAAQRPTPSDEELSAAYDEEYGLTAAEVEEHGVGFNAYQAHLRGLRAVAALTTTEASNKAMQCIQPDTAQRDAYGFGEEE